MEMLADLKDFFGFNYHQKRDMQGKFDLIDVAEAHILWKTHLGHHIAGNIREPLETALIGQDGICRLGIWINSSMLEPFCGLDVHKQLKEAHQQFHQFGDLIVEQLRAGDRGSAAAIFRNEYNQALRRIIQSLTEINKQLSKS